jgi:hypothetical protein
MTDQQHNDAMNAARYRWIKKAAGLEIRAKPKYGPPWTNTETGEKFYPTHDLAAFGTGFSGLPTLDELIDQAMEMYPND